MNQVAETKYITCKLAQDLAKKPGTRIFWRPKGIVNCLDPDTDAAEVMEG